MLFIWINNMFSNILYVYLRDFVSYFNYVVIFLLLFIVFLLLKYK